MGLGLRKVDPHPEYLLPILSTFYDMNAHTLRANIDITCHVGSKRKRSSKDSFRLFFLTTTYPIHHER